MSVLRGFLRFWYDFIVGDDWKIAFAIVLALAIGAALASGELADSRWLAPAVGFGVAAAFVASLLVDVRGK